jgi:hypothetical protein
MKTVNKYIIFDPECYICTLYTSLAYDKEHVRELAAEAGIDLTGLEIELERKDVRDQLRRPYAPNIIDAVVR